MDTERVADRLTAAAAAALVGRDAERDRLRAWVEDPSGPSAVFVHGPGGIGKTALVTGALAGPATVMIDGREVEPTPASVLAHIGSVLGIGRAEPTLGQVADAVAAAAVTALVVDSYERCAVVDGWLRNRLLPSLPARTTAVFAGRNPPNSAWRSAPGWRQLLVDVRLGLLTEAEAAELVARRGLDGDLATRARRFGRGHPLALLRERLLRFLGQGSMMLGSANLVAHWFSARRGFAMSLMALGFSASMAVHPQLGRWLIELVGWRGAWVGLGLITWALMMEGGFQVNAEGRRFSNEHQGYSEQAMRVIAQPGGFAWNIYDERLHRLGLDAGGLFWWHHYCAVFHYRRLVYGQGCSS